MTAVVVRANRIAWVTKIVARLPLEGMRPITPGTKAAKRRADRMLEIRSIYYFV